VDGWGKVLVYFRFWVVFWGGGGGEGRFLGQMGFYLVRGGN